MTREEALYLVGDLDKKCPLCLAAARKGAGVRDELIEELTYRDLDTAAELLDEKLRFTRDRMTYGRLIGLLRKALPVAPRRRDVESEFTAYPLLDYRTGDVVDWDGRFAVVQRMARHAPPASYDYLNSVIWTEPVQKWLVVPGAVLSRQQLDMTRLCPDGERRRQEWRKMMEAGELEVCQTQTHALMRIAYGSRRRGPPPPFWYAALGLGPAAARPVGEAAAENLEDF